jgi:hypothetical protein
MGCLDEGEGDGLEVLAEEECKLGMVRPDSSRFRSFWSLADFSCMDWTGIGCGSVMEAMTRGSWLAKRRWKVSRTMRENLAFSEASI